MKTLCTFFLFFIFMGTAHAQQQWGFTYSGVLTDLGGSPITAPDVDITVALYDIDGDCKIYEEQHLDNDLSTSNGAFYLDIGKGSSPNTFSNGFLENYFYKSGILGEASCSASYNPGEPFLIEITFNDQTNIETLPKQPIQSVPMAMMANRLGDKSANDFAHTFTPGNGIVGSLTGGVLNASIDTSNIASCSGTGNKITWNGTNFDCETDETGGGGLPTALTDSYVYVGNAGTASAVDITGDIELSNTGVTTLQADTVGLAELDDALCTTGQVLMKGPSTWACDSSVGDITDVTAGNGLSGGAASGAANLSIDSGICEAGSFLTWTGTAFGCETDQTGAGISGTVGKIPRINSGGNGLEDSIISNSASIVNIAGDLSLTGVLTTTGNATFSGNVTIGGNTITGVQTGGLGMATDVIPSEQSVHNFVNDLFMDASIGGLGGGTDCTGADALQWNSAMNQFVCGTPGGGGGTIDSLTDASFSGNNMIIGTDYLPTGTHNTGVGFATGSTITTGSYNSALGSNSISSITSGGMNTAIGFGSLQYLTTFNNNTALGYRAGGNVEGSGNVLIGANAYRDASSGNNNVVIGYNVYDTEPGPLNDRFLLGSGANILMEGDISTGELFLPNPGSKLGIGTNAPIASLEVHTISQSETSLKLVNNFSPENWDINVMDNGDITFKHGLDGFPTMSLLANNDVQVYDCIVDDGMTPQTGTCVSDVRFKENISPIESTLDKVSQINVVEYDWKKENQHIHGREGHEVGLIAQELEKIFPEMVVTDENGYKRIRYGVSFQLYQLKAVVEMSHKVKALEKENAELKKEIEAIKAHLGMK